MVVYSIWQTYPWPRPAVAPRPAMYPIWLFYFHAIACCDSFTVNVDEQFIYFMVIPIHVLAQYYLSLVINLFNCPTYIDDPFESW